MLKVAIVLCTIPLISTVNTDRLDEKYELTKVEANKNISDAFKSISDTYVVVEERDSNINTLISQVETTWLILDDYLQKRVDAWTEHALYYEDTYIGYKKCQFFIQQAFDITEDFITNITSNKEIYLHVNYANESYTSALEDLDNLRKELKTCGNGTDTLKKIKAINCHLKIGAEAHFYGTMFSHMMDSSETTENITIGDSYYQREKSFYINLFEDNVRRFSDCPTEVSLTEEPFPQ